LAIGLIIDLIKREIEFNRKLIFKFIMLFIAWLIAIGFAINFLKIDHNVFLNNLAKVNTYNIASFTNKSEIKGAFSGGGFIAFYGSGYIGSAQYYYVYQLVGGGHVLRKLPASTTIIYNNLPHGKKPYYVQYFVEGDGFWTVSARYKLFIPKNSLAYNNKISLEQF